jgi:hypothetical protein
LRGGDTEIDQSIKKEIPLFFIQCRNGRPFGKLLLISPKTSECVIPSGTEMESFLTVDELSEKLKVS